MKYETYNSSFIGFCCVFNRWMECIKGYLSEYCGNESPQIIVDLINSGLVWLPDQFCPSSYFDPQSKICTDVLPPLDTNALGAKSDSLFSWIFTWLCPNVGYGITD